MWTQWRKTEHTDYLRSKKHAVQLIYNKLDANFHLSNKKALFMNVSQYFRALGRDPFEVAIPLTFHIKSSSDQEFARFEKLFKHYQ